VKLITREYAESSLVEILVPKRFDPIYFRALGKEHTFRGITYVSAATDLVAKRALA